MLLEKAYTSKFTFYKYTKNVETKSKKNCQQLFSKRINNKKWEEMAGDRL